MIHENEIAMAILGLGVAAFLFINYSQLKRIQHFNILYIGYFILLFAWIATVVEDFFLYNVLNITEHLCYMASSFFLLCWIWKVFIKKGNDK